MTRRRNETYIKSVEYAIRHFAKQQGKTLRAVERAAGYGSGDLHDMMRHDIQVSSLVKIAGALGVPAPTLLAYALELKEQE